MGIVARFLQLIEQNGYRVENPRPRLDLALEKVIEEEREVEERSGESEPVPVPDLSGNVRLLSKGDGRLLLYAAECTLEQGFWGVSINDVSELKQQPLPWAVV